MDLFLVCWCLLHTRLQEKKNLVSLIFNYYFTPNINAGLLSMKISRVCRRRRTSLTNEKWLGKDFFYFFWSRAKIDIICVKLSTTLYAFEKGENKSGRATAGIAPSLNYQEKARSPKVRPSCDYYIFIFNFHNSTVRSYIIE